ncbi:hypothetical protein V8E54_015174 [Elaphomyces granulatus]
MAALAEDEDDIYNLAGECEELFQHERLELEFRGVETLQLFDEYQQRFTAWTAYLGVFAKRSICLDRKLRQHPDLRDLVVRLLDILKTNLIQIAQFRNADREFSSSEDGHRYRTSATEMDLLKAIDGAIDRLNRLGIAIRKSSTRSSMARDLTDMTGFKSFKELALVFLKTLYPDANDELHEQLGMSMAERYSGITSRQSRHDLFRERRPKLSPCLPPIREDTEVSDQPRPVIPGAVSSQYRQMAERIAPRRDNILRSEPSSIDRQALHQKMDASSNAGSRKKETSSIQIHQVTYPKAPQGSSNWITCEWCFETREKSYFEGDNWRMHVDKDFKPYICISEKCSETTCSFATFKSWHGHMLEKHGLVWHEEVHPPSSWLCAICHGTVDGFRSPEALYTHMESTHQFTETQLEAIVHQSRIQVRRQQDICPLCCLHVEEDSALSTDPRKRQQEPPPSESIPKRARTSIDLRTRTSQITNDTAKSSPSQQIQLGNIAKDHKSSHIEMAMARHVAAHLQGLMFLTIRLMSLLDDSGQCADIGSSSGNFSEDQQEYRDDITCEPSDGGDAISTEYVTPPTETRLDESQWHLMEIDRDARFTKDDCVLEQFRSRASMAIGDDNGPGSPQPRTRDEFKIAIICALPLEASVVSALFDKRWDDQRFGKAPRDSNTYSTGAIGHHNIVLVHMPNMGKVAAATAAACLRASFPEIQLALVVGICGGAPYGNQDILLGDVIISKGLVQYDLWRKFPNNISMRKDTLRDNLPRPSPEIRAALAKYLGRSLLDEKTSGYLRVLRHGGLVTYPGVAEDKLFKSTYRHKHHTPLECAICAKDDGGDDVCSTAVGLSCEQIKCDEQELVLRGRQSQPYNPAVHFGIIASGDTMIKSGKDRDNIATRDGVIAFEMEGAGIWENFPGCLVIKGVSDYADGHKSKIWQNYAAATAAAVMKGFLENWNPDLPRQPSPHLGPRMGLTRRAREIEILKWLNRSPYQDRKERNPERIRGTCEWFLTHELFRDWHESKSSTMLWVSADPGCGKSVLIKYLVDSILATNESRTTCYFFFKDDFEDQRNAVSALCCIIRQLFMQKRALLSDMILEQFEAGGERLCSSFSDLWAILLSAAEDKNAGEIVCLLDAIDECEDYGKSQLAQALCKLYGTRSSFNLKFLLTSRPYGGIRRSFQPLEIQELPISREIDIFIKARVRDIGGRLKLKNDEQELLLQELMYVPNRTYLWVHLTLDLVESDIAIDKSRIVNTTSHLPKTVDEAYDRILSKSHDFKKAKKILHIIVVAVRPLTLREMALALTIRENHRDLDLKSEDRLRETIRDICGLFVTIIDSRIYLLHETAKEFLVQNDQEIHPESLHLKWKRSLRPQDSHRVLTDICMRYLLFTEFEANPLGNDAMLSQDNGSHVFLDYSAKHWAAHVRESHIEVDNVATQSMLRLCDTSSKRCLTWFRIYWASTNTDFPKGFTGVMIASYFGLVAVVKHLLELDIIDLNSKDDTYGRSAISWAAGNGFDAVVELLTKGIGRRLNGIRLPFRKRAQVDSVDRYGRTPLMYGVWNGHVAIIKRLLKAGARTDLADDIGGTALSYAICSGHNDMLRLLFKKGTKADSEDDTRMALLLSASEKGHEAVIKLLLESGKVNLDLKDWNGRTPLSCAVEGGSVAVIQLLLAEGVKTDYKYNITPLSRAAEKGDERVVKLLLENGAQPDFEDENGRTPLSRAGSVAITPLSRAAEKGNERVVKLENGAQPDFEDENGQTPLSRG